MLMYLVYLTKKDFSSDFSESFEKSKEGLPSKDKLYNTLTNCAVSYKNHEQVLNIWKPFKMNTMKDFYDLFLKVNILLLVHVFETHKFL